MGARGSYQIGNEKECSGDLVKGLFSSLPTWFHISGLLLRFGAHAPAVSRWCGPVDPRIVVSVRADWWIAADRGASVLITQEPTSALDSLTRVTE